MKCASKLGNIYYRLCKNTGYIPAKFNNGTPKRPKNYPEEYFARFKINSNLKY